MNINERGLALVKEFEGLELAAYPDPGTGGKPWTIGYGHTGPEVVTGMTITEAEAEELLRKDLERFEKLVISGCLGTPTTANQFGAMVSLAYNIGPANFNKSTVLKLHRQRRSEGAAAAFLLWNKAGGKVMAGLVRRRKAERALYLEADG